MSSIAATIALLSLLGAVSLSPAQASNGRAAQGVATATNTPRATNTPPPNGTPMATPTLTSTPLATSTGSPIGTPQATTTPSATPGTTTPSGTTTPTLSPTPLGTPVLRAGPSSFGGVVFQDYNANGVRDTDPNAGAVDRGIPGVTVTAYDAMGRKFGPTTTGTDGSWSLDVSGGSGQYRVEFTGFRDLGFEEGPFGPDSGTAVQFLPKADGSTVASLGLIIPSEYCQDNPTLATSCYVLGDQVSDQNKDLPVVVSFKYGDGSSRTNNRPTDPCFIREWYNPYPDAQQCDDSDFDGLHAIQVKANQVGTTWGLRYGRSTRRLYAAAYMKRHAGFGPGGPGAIYVIDPANSGVVNTFIVHSATTDDHDPNVPCDVRVSGYVCDNFEIAAGAVGKTSLGGLAVSEDDSTIYVMNLENRTLYALSAIDGIEKASQAVPRSGLTTGGGTRVCAADDVRPFAVTVYHGDVYVGAVCSAQTSQNRDDLYAYVWCEYTGK